MSYFISYQELPKVYVGSLLLMLLYACMFSYYFVQIITYNLYVDGFIYTMVVYSSKLHACCLLVTLYTKD